MKIERIRPNTFRLTLTGTELAALIGAARMTLEALAHDPYAPPEASRLLERLVADYERSLDRLRTNDDGHS